MKKLFTLLFAAMLCGMPLLTGCGGRQQAADTPEQEIPQEHDRERGYR